MFIIEKCKTKAGYEARPLRSVKLDLNAIKKSFKLIAETPIVVVILTDSGQAVVHEYGKIFFKEGNEKMKEIARKIYDIGTTG